MLTFRESWPIFLPTMTTNHQEDAMTTNIDAITRKHTAFRDFQDMLNTDPHYRPTLRTTQKGQAGRELALLADAYDAARQLQGDSRRICRC